MLINCCVCLSFWKWSFHVLPRWFDCKVLNIMVLWTISSSLSDLIPPSILSRNSVFWNSVDIFWCGSCWPSEVKSWHWHCSCTRAQLLWFLSWPVTSWYALTTTSSARNSRLVLKLKLIQFGHLRASLLWHRALAFKYFPCFQRLFFSLKATKQTSAMVWCTCADRKSVV